MWQTFKFSVLSASILMTGFAVMMVLGFFKDFGVDGAIGAALGISLTAVVAIALMGLMFLSNRSHYDEDAHKAGRRE